jgi:hypothetical protein
MVNRAREAPIAPESCRSWAEQHFSQERMVERYLEIYDAVLTRTSPAITPRPQLWKM